jgi:hypothetical protein
MSGFHCIQPRVWRGERLRRAAAESSLPDPYAPSSASYRQRTKETETVLAPGMTRVDLGEPLKRLAGESQPVPVGGLPDPPADPAPVPAAAPAVSPAVPSRDWRDCYGADRQRLAVRP